MIFEGIGTNAALDNLRNKVGGNSLETEGDGVFGLSGAAGFDDSVTPEQSLDDAIDDGVETGNLDDFGTALASETAPTEDDFGLGDEPGDDFGGDPFGEDDTGAASDLGLDGLDDEFPEEEGTSEDANEEIGGETDGDIADQPDGDFDLGEL